MIFPSQSPVQLRDLLFPVRCVHCGRRALASGLCPVCRRALRPASADLPVPERMDRLIAAWIFDRHGPVRSLLHAIKFGNAPFLGERLGSDAAFAGIADGERWDAVLPVPIHRLRHTERGYNQCESIARGVGTVTNSPVQSDLIIRVRAHPPQAGQSRAQRLLASRGDYRVVMPHRVSGKRVLIVDDVVTTGATLSGVAHALRAAGASQVDGFAVAITLSKQAR